VRRALLLVVACGSPTTTPANRVPPRDVVVALDSHARLAANRTGIYAINHGQLVRLDRGLHVIATIHADPAWGMPVSVTATADRVFAGYLEGQIAELEPTPRELARASAMPMWLAVYRDQLIVGMPLSLEAFDLDGHKQWPRIFPRWGTSPAWQFKLASAALLAGDMLWYGIEARDQGGAGMLDLVTGKGCVVDLDFGVHGLVEVQGHVYAYGGASVQRGAIADVTGCTSTERYKSDRLILALAPHQGGFLAVAGTDLDDVSPDLTRWTQRAVLLRPSDRIVDRDANNDYFGVIGTLVLPDATLIATRDQGLWAVRGREIMEIVKP
jgi:hypothetical protein